MEIQRIILAALRFRSNPHASNSTGRENGSMRAYLSVFLLLTYAGCARAADSLPGLKVRTADGGSTYRIGERIRLKLSFTSAEARRYEINEASYDRSGRMGYESFQVLPAKGWSDPLQDYFQNRVLFGGGLTNFSALTTAPFNLEIDLNEWVRFEQPGVYTVQIRSGRVSDIGRHRKGEERPLALKSNSITLWIVPAEKEWQQQKLAAIASALAATPAQMFSSESSPRKQAASALRFLGTEGAIDMMTQYYREDEGDVWGQCQMGLLGLPAGMRASAVASLKKRISEPEFPVFSNLLITVAFLQSKADDPESGVERDEGESLLLGSPEERKAEEEAWNLAYQSLDRKEGEARAATLKMLFEWHPEHTPPQVVEDLNRKMSSSLLSLGARDQQELLDSHWDILRSPEIVPVLRQMAAPWPKSAGSKEMRAAYRGYPQAVALFRWYEVDPVGAHEEILRQIGSAHPTLYADAVDFLPGESLPEFEAIWADALKRNENEDRQGVLLSLMARFGSGTDVETVRELAQGKMGIWGCREQSAALAYLVRFDETGAPGMVEDAVTARGKDKTGCNHSVFTDVGEYVSNSVLLAEAVKALDDPDKEVVLDALKYLEAHGDQSVEQPTLQHYLKWSDHWRGHESRLENREAGELGPSSEGEIGKELVRAVMANQGWVPSTAELDVAALQCVGKDACAEADEIHKKSAVRPISISFWDVGQRPQLTLAQFTPGTMELLEEKIRQFPRGTRFNVYQFGETETKNQVLKQRIVKMLEEAGMVAQ